MRAVYGVPGVRTTKQQKLRINYYGYLTSVQNKKTNQSVLRSLNMKFNYSGNKIYLQCSRPLVYF